MRAARRKPERSLKLKPADPFELIRWLARSQSDPRKAVAELVQNSLDAGALRVIIERFRSDATRRQRLIDSENIFDTLSAPARPRDVSLDFEAALETLPDGAREIFVLHDVDGYKHGEIAELLGISTGTSKAQLHRARMMLRRHLR